MPKMVIAHPVIDTQRWLKGKADRVALLGQYATEVTDHVAINGSNNVAITLNVHDMAGLQALMNSPHPMPLPKRRATVPSSLKWCTSRSSSGGGWSTPQRAFTPLLLSPVGPGPVHSAGRGWADRPQTWPSTSPS